MKLPTFQQQQGTSMGSAMTSPARVGQIKQRTAETRPLVSTRDVQGELRLGLQKSKAALAIGQAVTGLAATTMQTMQANDTLEQEAAAAEYTNRSAATAIELKRDANNLNEDTGKFGYETFDEDMKRHGDALEAELREKFSWSSQRSEYSFKATVDGSNVSNSRTLNTFANSKYAEKNKALFEVSLAGANTAQKAKEIIAKGVKTGTIFDFQVEEYTKAWQAGATYDLKTQQIPQMGINELLTFRDSLDANEGEIDAMTSTQKSALNTQIDRQIMNTHLAVMTTAAKKGGTRAMGNYVEALRNTGVSATGARDPVGSEKILQSLGAVYKRQVLRDQQSLKAQESVVGSDTFFAPIRDETDSYARSIAIQESPAIQKDIDLKSREMAASPDFYQSGAVLNTINRGIEMGRMPDPFEIRMGKDITDGNNIQQAKEFWEYINERSPGLIKLNPAEEKKLQFYRGQDWMGIEHDEILKNYSKKQTNTVPEETLARQQAASSLGRMKSFNATFVKAVKDFAPDDESFKKGGIFYGTTMTEPVSEELQSMFLEFHELTGDDNAALKLTYDAYKSTHGLNKLYEEPKFERYPPSFMTAKPQGMTDDEFEVSLATQHQEQLDTLNASRTGNVEELTTANTKLRYTDDPNNKRWIVVNLYGQAVAHPEPNADGSLSPVQFKYSGFSNISNTKVMQQENDANFLQTANQTDAMIAERNRSIEMTNFMNADDESKISAKTYGYENIYDKDHDWDYRSVYNTRDYMEKKWSKMDEEQKDAANSDWHEKSEMLFDAFQSDGIIDVARIELMTNRYLFMKGYMRDAGDGTLSLPPGATRKHVVEPQ